MLIFKTRKLIRAGLLTLVGVLLIALRASPICAAGAISQGYQTTDVVSQGTLMSLTAAGSTAAEPANSDSAANLIGIAANKPLLELSGNGKSTVQVAVSGVTPALVSDMNGAIKIGDKITASPVSGIGMKASASAQIVGTAQVDFSSLNTVVKTVTGKSGKDVVINVGLLPVAVNIAYYTAAGADAAAPFVPPFLQAVANAVAGRQVSPLRVLISAVLITAGFVTILVMLYVAIRSGVISIGRNPLAAKALNRELVDVIVAALGVLTVSIIASYATLLT